MRTNCSSKISLDSISRVETHDLVTDSKDNCLYMSPKSSIYSHDAESDAIITTEVEKIFIDLFQSELSLFSDNKELVFGQLLPEASGHIDYFDSDILTRQNEIRELTKEDDKESKSKSSTLNSRYSLKGLQLFKTIKKAAPSLTRSDSTSSKTTVEALSEYSGVEYQQSTDDDFCDETQGHTRSVCSEEGEGDICDYSVKDINGNSSMDSASRGSNLFNFTPDTPAKSSSRDTFHHESTSITFTSPHAGHGNSSPSSTKSRKSFASFRSSTPLVSDENLSRNPSQRSEFSTASTSSWSSTSTENEDNRVMELAKHKIFVPLDIPTNLGDFSASSILNELGIVDEKEVKRSQSLNTPSKAPDTRSLRKNSSSVDLPLLSGWDRIDAPQMLAITSQREFIASKQLNGSLRPNCNEARYFVAEEIFTTEISYLENLEIILNTFMIPIQDMAKTSSPVIGPHDSKIIFQGIESLYELSQDLCYKLKNEIENWNEDSQIGCLFLKRQRSWDIYPKFVDNYSFAREAIQRAEGTPSFSEFMKNVAKNDTKRQTLKEFLIIPIQRVTRYTLLLKDLQKQTPENHPDYNEVTEALKFMKELAVRVNEVKQKEEERTQLFTIFNSIRNCPPTMINSKRRFALETDLVETRTNRKLHLVLYSDYLMLATPGKARQLKTGEKWVFLRLIDLRHIILFNVPDTKDATNLTVIFVSNPFPTVESDNLEPIGTQAGPAVNTMEIPPGSPPPSPKSSSRTSFVESRKRSYSKKQMPPNQYVFQHFDRKSKVEFLIALENELSNIRKKLGGKPRNFIQTFNHLHSNTF